MFSASDNSISSNFLRFLQLFHFGFLWENKKLHREGFSSKLGHNIKIPNGENARNWVANVVFKFHDDPTVNKPEIVVFLRQVW